MSAAETRPKPDTGPTPRGCILTDNTTVAPVAAMLVDCKGALPVLALRPREAAKALGISPRTLWTLTTQGHVPHLRLGRAVLYPVDSLREFLGEQAKKGTKS